ncbi:MAG: response regulator [Bryobacteraceae bacterium]|nr:response regulator [Bryobacteraceae bacterium]MDW8377419.1 response regulator [Bryobacterales bacterium]
MTRILLADDSPHAQRMGERILQEEGYEVVSVTDGETALIRLADVDPDLILADAFLPGRSGFDICREVKRNTRFKHVRVVLTAGVLEPFDEQKAAEAGSDGWIKKPFEASIVLDTIKPLLEASKLDREAELRRAAQAQGIEEDPLDPERIRAAVTVALDRALPSLVEEISSRILNQLKK